MARVATRSVPDVLFAYLREFLDGATAFCTVTYG